MMKVGFVRYRRSRTDRLVLPLSRALDPRRLSTIQETFIPSIPCDFTRHLILPMASPDAGDREFGARTTARQSLSRSGWPGRSVAGARAADRDYRYQAVDDRCPARELASRRGPGS